VLTAVLLGHSPRLTVLPVEHADELAGLGADILRRARLVGFVTPLIVPPAILAQLGYGAFNFHPGSPSYPGWAPAHFALYDQAREFGATAHMMIEQVDAGPIVAVELFPVPADISVLALEGMTYARLESGRAAGAADQMGREKILPQHLSRNVRDPARHPEG
jgi:methionyl-tRNA formyltransferase